MTIAVTGATGPFGRHVIKELLASGLEPGELVAVVRDQEKAADLGVEVRVADYGDADALQAAFKGIDRLLFVSGSEVGQRIPQHTNVIEAAKAAKVGYLVYTSAPHADSSDLVVTPDHRATEKLIKDSGIPATILRNNWYTENYAPQLDEARRTGAITAAAGEGRVASASRADFAAAAAVVINSDDHQGQVYELAGDVAWDYAELAEAIGAVIGSEVTYRSVDADTLVNGLTAAGLDAGTAGFLAALDGNIAAGLLADTGDQALSRLIGRPTTPLVEGLRQLG